MRQKIISANLLNKDFKLYATYSIKYICNEIHNCKLSKESPINLYGFQVIHVYMEKLRTLYS